MSGWAPPRPARDGGPARPLTALDMAQNAARAVLRYADAQDADPVGSHVHGFGDRGHQAAQLAGAMALVSIAEDLHRIVGIMTGQGAATATADEPPGPG